MTLAKNKILLFFALTSFLGAFSAQAYPIWIKIVNPRDNVLYIESESEKITIAIPPGSTREFKIAGSNDWRVRYASGIYGLKDWNLDKDLNFFIDQSCKNCMGDNWGKKTVKYCTLRLEELPGSFGAPATYTLTVTEIRDLAIGYDAPECALSANEVALKVVPMSKNQVLIIAATLAQAMVLFNGQK
jgi:hypothetical protein